MILYGNFNYDVIMTSFLLHQPHDQWAIWTKRRKLTERVEFQMFRSHFLSSWSLRNKQATLKWLQGQLQSQLQTKWIPMMPSSCTYKIYYYFCLKFLTWFRFEFDIFNENTNTLPFMECCHAMNLERLASDGWWIKKSPRGIGVIMNYHDRWELLMT